MRTRQKFKSLQGSIDFHGVLYETLCDKGLDEGSSAFNTVENMIETLCQATKTKYYPNSAYRAAGEYNTPSQRRVWLCRSFDRNMQYAIQVGALGVSEANAVTKDLIEKIRK